MNYKLLAGVILSGVFLQGTGFAANTTNNIGPAQKKQVEGIVHDYLISNPEVVVQSLEAYQRKQMDETKKTFVKIQDASPKFADRLFHQAGDPIGGNPQGKITVVEFSDYQCPHCIEMSAILDDLIKKNNNIRVVFKEFPIRGPISEMAAHAALAAQKQGKYYEFHSALMQSKTEPLTEEAIFDIAKSVGLNVDQLKTDMKDKAVDQKIQSNYDLAKEMELIWTPILFVAKSDVTNNAKADAIVFIPGRVEPAQLNKEIEKVSG